MVVRLAQFKSPDHRLRAQQNQEVKSGGWPTEGPPRHDPETTQKKNHQGGTRGHGSIGHKLFRRLTRAPRAHPREQSENPHEERTPVHLASVRRVVQIRPAHPPRPFAEHFFGMHHPPTGIDRGIREHQMFLAGAGRQLDRVRRHIAETDRGNFADRRPAGEGRRRQGQQTQGQTKRERETDPTWHGGRRKTGGGRTDQSTSSAAGPSDRAARSSSSSSPSPPP